MRKRRRFAWLTAALAAVAIPFGFATSSALGVGLAVCYWPNGGAPCFNYGGMAPGARDYENFVSGQTTGTFMATQSTTIPTEKRVAVTNGLTATPIAGPWYSNGTTVLRVEWSARDWKSFWCENAQASGNIASRCGYYGP
jgi:hypothetical protein